MTTHSAQPDTTPQAAGPGPRSSAAAGLLTVVAGAVQGDGALITAVYRNASPVSEERLSFPWAGATAITTSLTWGITQLLIVVGLIAFTRGGAAPTAAGRVGGRLAVGGAVLYVIAHGLSLVAYDATVDDPIAVAVVACFGIGTVLTAIGLIVAGTATLRCGVWVGWRRYAPLGLGVWMVAMTPLQFTPALPVAVGVYALALIALGLAMIVESMGRPPR